jgi:metal-dependent amidase/aminoacylase/carboxypeptidase family protein
LVPLQQRVAQQIGVHVVPGSQPRITASSCSAAAGVDLAMMVHPAPVNAADAFTVAQVAIGLLRQHLASEVRVHGIVAHGGNAPDAAPEHTAGRWYVRAETLAELAEIEPRVRRCFEAGAVATGCELRIEPESKPYAEFRADEHALAAYRANAVALGRTFAGGSVVARMNRASTDMGNVSQVVPAIHPFIGIGRYPASTAR